MKAQLLFWAHFLQNGTLIGTRLEVALMTGQLYPRIALLFVRLKEGRPLHDVSQLAPTGWLEREYKIRKIVDLVQSTKMNANK